MSDDRKADTYEHMGGFIRSCHPYAYKSGQWGEIVGACFVDGPEGVPRPCWDIVWPDGSVDTWPMLDSTADYEFRETADA